jgi:hypothetical protein
MAEKGPLAFWLGAICIKLFGGILGDPMAARLSTGFFFLLGSVSVWYATYLLGRRAEAQPLKLAFGGQPDPKDFGRTLADGALLIYLGCLGLLVRSHETGAETLQISLVAFTLYVCVRLARYAKNLSQCTTGTRPRSACPDKRMGTACDPISGIDRIVCLSSTSSAYPVYFLGLPVALIPVAIWLLAIKINHPYDSSPIPAWMLWNYRQINWPSLDSISYFFKYSIWFAWPAWPFAAWAIYAWRRQERALHIALPSAFLIGFIVLALMSQNSEESLLLPLLPPIAILAAFGLPTMKRSAINAVDWFAVTVLTGTAGFIWLGWIAANRLWARKF